MIGLGYGLGGIGLGVGYGIGVGVWSIHLLPSLEFAIFSRSWRQLW
jgi:hypothetical protein